MTTPLVTIAGTGISLDEVIMATVIVAGAVFLLWGVRQLIVRAERRLGEGRAATVYVAGQVARYVIAVTALVAAVSALGVDLSALSLFAGALGVGVGLGLQDVIKNFVCGIVLLFDGSVEVGDYLELEDDTTGAVIAIGPRATTLRTSDHVDVLVPNSALLGGKLTNWTRERASRRIHVPFGVAYGTDKELVRKAALEAAHSVFFTLPEDDVRKTQVWLTGFGDSALEFELVVWPSLAAVKRPGSMYAAYFWALDDALRAYDIEVPFPQRDIRVRTCPGHEGDISTGSIADELERSHSRTAATPSANDAADDIDEAAALERGGEGSGEGRHQ